VKRVAITTIRISAIFCLTILFLCNTLTTQAATHNLGVSVGQWVKYGNFKATGFGSGNINATEWTRIEVIEVAGNNVTLSQLRMYKNGTFAQDETIKVNTETGWSNGDYDGFSFLMAANLQQGDILPTGRTGPVIHITKTEVKGYLGTLRTVNTVDYFPSEPGAGSWTIVWDQASGIVLELWEGNGSINPPFELSYNITDTNIFPTNLPGQSADRMIAAVITTALIATVIMGIVVMIRRPKKPKSATTNENSQ
jgi:hypothetical protein